MVHGLAEDDEGQSSPERGSLSQPWRRGRRPRGNTDYPLPLWTAMKKGPRW